MITSGGSREGWRGSPPTPNRNTLYFYLNEKKHNTCIDKNLSHLLINKMPQSCSQKSFNKIENLSTFGALPPWFLYQGSALDPLGSLNSPKILHRISSSLTQNPGSTPDYSNIFIDACIYSVDKRAFYQHLQQRL